MISQDHLKKLLNYNKTTGVFTWKIETKNKVKRGGDVAGCINTHGYVQIQLEGKVYLAHRLAHLYVEGYFPEHVIDHINGDASDNRWENLRHVSVRCNLQNGNLSKNNSSGFNGVYLEGRTGRWIAAIKINRKRITIGSYASKIDAAIARVKYEDSCQEWRCNSQDYNRKKLLQLGYLI